VGVVVGAEAPSATVELDYGQLLYRTYQAVLGGVTLHFWATSDLEDVCLPGCEVEACALPPPEPLDAALYAYDDTPGEKLRTGMVFGPVVALCAALDALLTAREQSPPEVTELTELTELTEVTELTELTELTEVTEVTELTELTELTARERSPQTGALGSTARRGGGSGLRLLELGAGVGLVGLWAAARGAQDGAQLIAQAVLTDRNSASLELMRRNAAFFAERATTAPTTAAPTTAAPIVQVSALDWAGAHPSWLDGSFDLVAASEALNVPAAVPLFFATAAAALREGGRLVLAMQRRSAWRSGVLLDREVLPAAKAVGLALETPEVDLRQGADARDDARLGCEAQATVILTFILRCRVQTG
jgi:SAM-dependent methyltransferase